MSYSIGETRSIAVQFAKSVGENLKINMSNCTN